MRRPLAALLLGAVSLAGLVPVAAGAAQLPKGPFAGPRKPVLRLACDVVRQVDGPAVSCSWSTPPGSRYGFGHYRLFKLELNARTWRQVIYRGGETSFVDEKVEAGRRYKYLVRAVDRRGHAIGTSHVADVAVPPVVTADPARQPEPKPRPRPEPRPEPQPVPDPEPRREPMPEPEPRPLPEPKPVPLPTPKPEPRPEPKPIPEPDPRPIPAPARMKLACGPQRFDVVTNAETTDNSTRFAPSGPVVVCEWAAPADVEVASYALWRGERPEGTRQVIFKSVDATRHVDRAVSSGHAYAYGVKAFDANGRVVAQSDVVPVSFPATSDTDAAV
jgi:hypothetical protein